DETARRVQLSQDAQAEGDFGTGIGAVLEAMLLSPRFLFVLEAGQAGHAGTAGARAPPPRAARPSVVLSPAGRAVCPVVPGGRRTPTCCCLPPTPGNFRIRPPSSSRRGACWPTRART